MRAWTLSFDFEIGSVPQNALDKSKLCFWAAKYSTVQNPETAPLDQGGQQPDP